MRTAHFSSILIGGVSAEGGVWLYWVYTFTPLDRILDTRLWKHHLSVAIVLLQKFCCTIKDKMSVDRFPKTVGVLVANSIQEQSDEWGNSFGSDKLSITDIERSVFKG